MVDECLTLEQIDGRDWGNPDAGETGMVARCRRLRRTPLKDLSVSDLRLLIGQQIGLNVLVPRALLRLPSPPKQATASWSTNVERSLRRTACRAVSLHAKVRSPRTPIFRADPAF